MYSYMLERIRISTMATLLVVLVSLVVAACADAAPTVKFNASLKPEKLGRQTTVWLGFDVVRAPGELPPALTSFKVQLPAGMGLADTSLGVDTCSASVLTQARANLCPRDSLMGRGNALAEAPFGTGIVQEPGAVSVFMTEARDNNTTVLFYFDGKIPVIAPLVFPSEFVSPGDSPISELQTVLPLIPALPGTEDAAIVSMLVNLGPKNLTYYKRVGKRQVAYKPTGMSVPSVCPRGGFRFSAYFGFADGTHATASQRIPCP
jgi:hypothetical protein